MMTFPLLLGHGRFIDEIGYVLAILMVLTLALRRASRHADELAAERDASEGEGPR